MRNQNWPVLCALLALPCRGAEPVDDGLHQAVDQVLYRVQTSAPGVYRSNNPAQHLGIEFDAAGTRLQHPEGSVGAHLLGYGYGDNLRTPAPASPVATGSRVEYRRGDLIEWYKNEAGGLEQGFTLTRRPGIAGKGEPLVIALGLDGVLRPSMSPEGDAVLLGSALRYAGLHSWDARGRLVPSHLEVMGPEIRLVIDDRDAEYPLVVDPIWMQQQELTDIAGAANDNFGSSVAVDGDTAVIGAPGSQSTANPTQGHAFVLVRSGSPQVWTLQQELIAADGGPGDQFGVSVSVSGETVVVGAPNKNNNQGAAYVFVRSGGVPSGTWALQQKLTAPDGMAGDYFGTSVALSGNTLAVGAPGDTPFRTFRGNLNSLYVFVSGATTPPWSLQQELTVATGLGRAAAISGDTIVAGSGYCFEGYGPAFCRSWVDGPAYVFVRGATKPPWTEQQRLTANNAPSFFGWSVAVSGDTILIGASGDRICDLFCKYPGAAYVYARGATTPPWTLQQQLTVGIYGELLFGESVALSGNTAVIGAPVAHVFTRRGSSWSEQQELTASDGAMDDGFGGSVAISGNTAFVGAPNKTIGTNAAQGAAYVFVSYPQPVSVTPATGSGLGPQTFTAVYSDVNGGASDVQVVYLDIATSPGAASSCLAAYVQTTNSLYLSNDTNSALLGPIAPGSNMTVSNSQCTLSGGGGTVLTAGTVLIVVPFSINFQAGFSGAKNIYGLAQNYNGDSSNWQLLGNWTVGTPGPPSAVSVTPNSGSRLTQTFTAIYTDPAGVSDLQVVYLEIGGRGGSAYSCFVAYIGSTNSLYLYNDTNTAVFGPLPTHPLRPQRSIPSSC